MRHYEVRVSDEEIISQVQQMAEELGRTPTGVEFNKNPNTVGTIAIRSHFGSWKSFLILSGLS